MTATAGDLMTVTNMEPMVRRVLAISLIGTSFLVAACGGDDDSSESVGTGAGTTGATGPIQVPPISQLPDGDGRGGSGRGGSAKGNGAAGGSGGSSDSERSRNRSDRSGSADGRSGSKSPGRAGGSSPIRAGEVPPVASDSAAHRLAREICANVTLEGIAVNLRINLEKRDDKFVARAFSRSYPSAHRDAAYRGCLAGFHNPVER
jgi:hypothetical protein